MLKIFSKLFRPRRTGDDPAEEYLELAPHGRILVLGPTAPESMRSGCALSDRLMKFAGRPTPFVGLLVDLGQGICRLSEGDFASIVGTTAAWQRGWVAPCAIVVTGDRAAELNDLLRLTQLDSLPEIRVVDSMEAGIAHLQEQLERIGRRGDGQAAG